MAELPNPKMRSPSQGPGTARSSTSAGRWLIMISGAMQDLPRPRLRARGTRNARPVRRQAVSSWRSAPRPCTDSAYMVSEEVAGDAAGDPLMQLNKGELGRAVDGDQQIELALFGSDFREVDMEEADRVALELGAPRLVAVGVGQARDAVAL